MKLDIGCGNSKKDDFIGVDCLGLPNVDIVHDLDVFPYPFEDNSVDEVWMDQVLEHVKNPMKTMEEIYRICRNDSDVRIGVPYFRSPYAVIDPTHRNLFTSAWFNFFDPRHPFHSKYCYTETKYEIRKIEFDREFKKNKISIFHRLIIRFAEWKIHFYEFNISHMYPLNSLTFYLKVIK